jgi:hypothetical protein
MPARIAFCFSGQIRDFRITFPSFKRNILKPLREYEHYFFAHYPTPGPSERHPAVNFSDIHRESEEPDFSSLSAITNHDIARRGWHKISPMTAYLRQLRSIKLSDELRRRYETSHHFTFDIVFRLRFDSLFITPIEDALTLEIGTIYVPGHNSFNGYNDRFAFGTSEVMAIYSDRLDWIIENVQHGYRVHPEMSLKDYLGQKQVPVKHSRVVLHTLRHGELDRAIFKLKYRDLEFYRPSRPLLKFRYKVHRHIGKSLYDRLALYWWRRPI